MKIANPIKIVFLFSLLSLFGAGCSLFGGSNVNQMDGGVYQSGDYGSTWQAINFVGTARDNDITINNINTRTITIHPTDSNKIYLLTVSNGLYRSINDGSQWDRVNESLGNLSIFTIDPKEPATLYAVQGNLIIQSVDEGVNWQTIYIESDTAQQITSLIVDHFDNTKLYAGTSKGTVLYSDNSGQTWQVKSQLIGPIESMAFKPDDSRTLYTVTLNRGIWQSNDSADTWVELSTDLVDLNQNALAINDLAISSTSPATILIGTNYGVLQTIDGGGNWTAVPTTVLPDSLPIRTVAFDPQGKPILYFTVENKIHRSTDNGLHWSITQLPTSRWISELVVDPRDPAVLYVGFKPAQK
jgi:photosystem II stability/assembly factor-like uncharacterized protein